VNIIVCVKAVLDPELPRSKFRIDPSANKIITPEGMPPVIGMYDAHAMEAAMKLKDAVGGKLAALTVCGKPTTEALRHSLAMGADEAVMVADESLGELDGWGTAHVLAQAIKKIGEYDLILCGRQSADADAGQVGSLIAGIMGLPVVTVARQLAPQDGNLRVEKVLADGYQVLTVPFPAVITVGEEIGKARLPSGRGVIMAARKEITTWNASDIGVDLSQIQERAGCLQLQRLYIPVNQRECEVVQGKDGAEAAANLANRLRQAGLI